MSYNKVYENKPIWHNDREPSINETRLNALSNATDIIDNRVIELGNRGVENLPDVSITDLQDGQGIKWNEELQKWENGVVGGIVDITNAEYEYLVEHDLDDRTVAYNIIDRNPDGTLIDDSLTESATKTWSINNLSSKFSAINSTLENIRYSKYVEITQNIPASGGTFSDTEYDLSSYIPSNAKNVIVNLSRLGEYNLPYCDNQGKMLTGVIYYRASTKKVVLRNFTSAWNNYTAFFEISYEL